ncbi:hypothetical protein SDC9_74661 [bioreactor metagenome]|uniref:HD domain-containing protein n=1 Tax=bioreactor metagenome TaxID=1076179 RepID=A0A644YHP0_9ZZZZ
MDKMSALILEMIEFDAGEPELIHHFIKVHGFVRLICEMENIPPDVSETIEAAAVVHDIGIKVSMDKYGKSSGTLQEQEGPPYAGEMLKRLGFGEKLIDRVSFLVAHHHTYSNIDGIDYQILVEADFLVNFYENQNDKEVIKNTCGKLFKTASGREICARMFLAGK